MIYQVTVPLYMYVCTCTKSVLIADSASDILNYEAVEIQCAGRHSFCFVLWTKLLEILFHLICMQLKRTKNLKTKYDVIHSRCVRESITYVFNVMFIVNIDVLWK